MKGDNGSVCMAMVAVSGRTGPVCTWVLLKSTPNHSSMASPRSLLAKSAPARAAARVSRLASAWVISVPALVVSVLAHVASHWGRTLEPWRAGSEGPGSGPAGARDAQGVGLLHLCPAKTLEAIVRMELDEIGLQHGTPD